VLYKYWRSFPFTMGARGAVFTVPAEGVPTWMDPLGVEMTVDREHLLEVLKFELRFLEIGGYHRAGRTPWRPRFIFEDSPTCPNYWHGTRSIPCSECVLFPFVPADRRKEIVPCRHIVLNNDGDTVNSLYRYATERELESAMIAWLNKTIHNLESEIAELECKDHEGEPTNRAVSVTA
jgi:hypothetical protein